VATGRPNFAPIILHAVEMKVFLDRVDRLGYDYVYLGYHCMFDAEGRYQVIDYRSKAGEELVRLGDDFTRPIPSNYGFPEYVGARTLDSSRENETITNFHCYGRCSDGDGVTSDASSLNSGKVRFLEATVDSTSAPKTGHSPSVLRTLQPDQGELLYEGWDEPVFVQGPPGSGKTVVALYRAGRAAYSDSLHDGTRSRSVALIGPSERYVEFARPLFNQISQGTTDRIELWSFRSVVDQILDINEHNSTGIDFDSLGSSRGAFEFVETFAREFNWDRDPEYDSLTELAKQSIGGPKRKGPTELFHLWLKREASQSKGEVAEWIASLPSYASARTRPDTKAFIAYCRTFTSRRISTDYLIIDEAQDAPWIIWAIFSRIVKTRGGLTAFGDFAQRKPSSRSPEKWSDLMNWWYPGQFRDLRFLSRSYRCTRAILEFASKFVGEDTAISETLREGNPVRDHYQPLPLPIAISRGVQVCREFNSSQGRIAAVASLHSQLVEQLLELENFSILNKKMNSWSDGKSVVYVLDPSDSASVEYDMLVVIDLNEIMRLHGEGVTFTLLTRPSQELVILPVLHSN